MITRPADLPAPRSLARLLTAGALLAVGAVALAGCASPYTGVIIPGISQQTGGPPAAWVQRNIPISPAPVEYDRRTAMPPTGLSPEAPPVMELGTPTLDGPVMPGTIPVPGAAQTSQSSTSSGPQVFPPLAPGVGADDDALDGSLTGDTNALQKKIDELTADVEDLDRRLQEQAHALSTAQHDAALAQQMTQRLEAQFIVWQADLNLVRETIRAQNMSDFQALDELSATLEQLLPTPAPPEPQPPSDTDTQMVREHRPQGAAR